MCSAGSPLPEWSWSTIPAHGATSTDRWHTRSGFVVFGVNAIALFVGTGIMAKLMGIRIPVADGSRRALKSVIYSNAFAWWALPKVASLAFAIAFILLWLGLMWILYRRKIFIKV